LPRAMDAPDTENINGTYGHKHHNMSVLQQHVSFFDKDHDGIIYPWDTYRGTPLWLLVLIYGTNSVSLLVLDSTSPSNRLAHVQPIHKATRGLQGNFEFVPAHFEEMFSKYACTVPDKLTLWELCRMTEGNRVIFDFAGWLISKLEWALVYALAKDAEGFLAKESERRLFDGSFFEYWAKVQKGAGVGKVA
ncbi:caleosin H3, partial [Fagus crenata]